MECFTEFVFRALVLLLLVEDTALSDDGLSAFMRELTDEGLGVGHLLEFVLDVHLDLHNFICVLDVLNLRGNLTSFHVHAGLEERLGVVELVLGNIGVKLSQLVVVFGRLRVVLHIEVAVREQGKRGSASGRELQFVRQNSDDVMVLLVAEQTVNGAGVFAVGD